MATRIAIIQGHPDSNGRHYCHALADAYVSAAHRAGHYVDVIDVGAMTFPFVRGRADLEGPVPDVIRQAQDALKAADHIVLFFPIWNGGMPALLLAFMEQTFRGSFIFPDLKPGQSVGMSAYFRQRKGLAGKSGRIVVTMQMPAWLYRTVFRPRAGRSTLVLAGLKPLRETRVGNANARNPKARSRWLRRMEELGGAAR